MTDLFELDDVAFARELKNAIWDAAKWQAFLEIEIIDRTDDALEEIRADIDGQLVQHAGKEETDPDWVGRARRYLLKVNSRKGQCVRAIRNYNRAETAEVSAIESKWGLFAQALAEAIEGSEIDYVLDDIPKSDEINAREWLVARRAQRERKAARQASANVQ